MEKGESCFSLRRFIIALIDSAFYFFSLALPIKKNWVVFISVPDFSDNAFALYDYICKHNICKKYHLFWLVEEKKYLSHKDRNCTIIYKKSLKGYGLKKFIVMSMARFIITDHHFWLAHKKRQYFVSLCHGTPLKATKGTEIPQNKKNSMPNLVVSTSDLASLLLSRFLYIPLDILKPLGYPRNDYFFQRTYSLDRKVYTWFRIGVEKKILFWMPTFRQSTRVADCNEDYLISETGLPFFSTEQELCQLDNFLENNGCVLFFKIHPLQQSLPIFEKKFRNIIIISNIDLELMQIQLYQLLTLSDALITDYSSISYDYLLLNRPIIYTIDDMAQYKSNRGFVMDDPLNYMPGYHVESLDQFEDAIGEVVQGIDKYKEERKKLSDRIYLNFDGNASERISKFIGINL